MNLKELEIAHDRAVAHRVEVELSEFCRCFCCLATFRPQEITEWISEGGGETAICPKCGIDAVIGSASGLDMSDAFFAAMSSHWF